MSTPSLSSQVIFGDRRRPAGGSGDDTVNPWDLLRGIWARKAVVGGTALAILLISVAFIAIMTPTYTAEPLLRIEPRAGEISRFDDLSPLSLPDQGAVESEIQELTSYSMIARLVSETGLDKTAEFNPSLRKEEGLGALFGSGKKKNVALTEIVEDVQGRLSIYRKGESRVISINFTSQVPARAALVANRLAELYIQKQIETRQALHGEATGWLREQIDTLREEVRKSEAAAERFRSKHGLFMTGESSDRATLPQRELSELTSQLVLAEATYSEAQARLSLARDLAGPSGADAGCGGKSPRTETEPAPCPA